MTMNDPAATQRKSAVTLFTGRTRKGRRASRANPWAPWRLWSRCSRWTTRTSAPWRRAGWARAIVRVFLLAPRAGAGAEPRPRRDGADALANRGDAPGDNRLDTLELAGERTGRQRSLDAVVVVHAAAGRTRRERAALAVRNVRDLRTECPSRGAVRTVEEFLRFAGAATERARCV